MKYLGVNEIRKMFLKFWESKGCLVHDSYSLVPQNDKSLLLIAAGMAPLKPYFAGTEEPPRHRMTTCQKCIRTNDIDNVGHTARHATFFEMLGNFSFGDYFKRESLTWGWEFVTGEQWLAIPKEKIWATVYENDDEAYNIWKNEIGMPEERIVRLGKDDNFWEIGTGPCGPCSEIYYDRGPEYGCGKPDCKPGCDCDRYMEFWNHVFTQFDRQEDGTYLELQHKNIDTGMGLERMACIMQGVDSIYSVDTMQAILQEVCRMSGKTYTGGASADDISIRIITDHIRAVSFMICDGILPSNEGRGYILRRLLRRAARHGRLLGIKGTFLKDLCSKVFETSGEAYPDLLERADYIRKIIGIEEDKFAATIDQGQAILDSYIQEAKASGSKLISGEHSFRLYDTYGFPIELTREIAEDAGLGVDEEGFNACMKAQKDQARAARKAEDNAGWLDESAMYKEFAATEFTGYESLAGQAKVIGIVKGMSMLDSASEGEEVRVILDSTPFYGEGGGQIGDTGVMEAEGKFSAAVTNTTKVNGVYVHHVSVTNGTISVGDEITVCVDEKRRHAIARNHTATHLLQKALRIVLGDHVEQAGSLVTEDGLRFDFTHFEAISKEDLQAVEDIVNNEILKFTAVDTKVLPIEEAKKLGAMMLFGEKYGDNVRVVDVPGFSMEFCGGTHVANIGQIGSLRITSESGVAAGVRRIEAITGSMVGCELAKEQDLIALVAEALKTTPANLLKRAENLAEENKALKKELEELKKAGMDSEMDDMIASAKTFGEAKLVTKTFEGASIDDLRGLSDSIKKAYKGIVMVFASVNAPKATLMVSVTDDLVGKGYHAGNMIKEIAKAAGGGGGGKADMAQAGAKDISKLSDAFAVAEKLMAR